MSGPAAASGDVDEGAEFFKKRCKSCHDIEAGKHKMGPSLAGVMGRKAGSTDFPKYTGLAGSEVVWDEESLDKFLADPKEFVGAKTMAYKVKKEEDRANVIEFMKTLK
jgi:cytochrome c